MRAVVQRVASASVVVDDQVVGQIGRGVLVYLGISTTDTLQAVAYLVNKVRHLRIFNDPAGKMNLDVLQAAGACLVVSAFSTLGDTRKGHRPAFVAAAEPTGAGRLYDVFCEQLRLTGVAVETGRFRASMQVASVNDGPICILLDSEKTF